jgi:hypothetical protein
MAIAAPVIKAEMAVWTRLGGGNSGIAGNALHTSGFHRAANEVPATDYSRRHDPNGSDGPYTNWNYACAGDFAHRGNAKLRAMHANVLARLQRGELPMICEFIGRPWPDRPVYYWARWNGVTTLQRYTGSGHDVWSHISWYRSRADQKADLWIPTTGGDDMPFGVGEAAMLKDIHWAMFKSDAAGRPADSVTGRIAATAKLASEIKALIARDLVNEQEIVDKVLAGITAPDRTPEQIAAALKPVLGDRAAAVGALLVQV